LAVEVSAVGLAVGLTVKIIVRTMRKDNSVPGDSESGDILRGVEIFQVVAENWIHKKLYLLFCFLVI